MCGIFGLISSSDRRGGNPGMDLFAHLDELVRFGSGSDHLRVGDIKEAERAGILEKLGAAQSAAYGWLGRDAFLEALQSPELETRLRSSSQAVTRWTEALSANAATGGLTRQADWEFVNRLIVGGKDIAWQLERDLIGNFDPIRTLLGTVEGDGAAFRHAWQLNLTLTSLNRLEVRGRDSAGIAAYLRFPDSGALERFLDTRSGSGTFRDELARRSRFEALTHATLARPATSHSTVLAVFKVANEVGKMGDNVAYLRNAISGDAFFQSALREPGVELQCLAHTRWASNGIISLPNCHPVDGAFLGVSGEPSGQGEVIGVLNGDVDNYQDLLARYIRGNGLSIDPSITTDAKIIPIVVGHHYRETRDLLESFRRAFAEFEGSMAIGVMAADRPGEFVFGQKGSGQGLFLGLRDGAVAIASEMYGLVELTPRYVKAEGERTEGGEVFHLRSSGASVEVDLCDAKGSRPLPKDRVRTAEITTRDIHRAEYPHFFLKEINESVESVRKTLRGKFDVADGRVRSNLGPDVLPQKLLDALRSGRITRVTAIGQGTAAVAGEGIAHLLEKALATARPPIQISAMKATELSAHQLRDDMSDTLLVTVSQSGTTTDTNRTVDMARERGAWIIGIVNRRNSDLVYKSHGVLYTSDGRDIEMSVASTKAYYAQNVAGQVIALALALELGTLTNEQVLAEVQALDRLPSAMSRVLDIAPQVEKLAERFALARRHWAIVGTGWGKAAANEARIKLSELCYKSIAVDYLEDKKHIDLSSEPLILVCANGLPAGMVSDAVKEVAIFKAHKSIPVVITDEGETRFDPYAAGTIRVPRTGDLSYLLTTMVAHLFGYYAAARFEHFAEKLRAIRAEVLSAAESPTGLRPVAIPPALTEKLRDYESLLVSGELDGGLDAGAATRLSRAINVLLGWLPVDVFTRQHAVLAEGVLTCLFDAIQDLSRSIDAIKHQAKTVTVGISRGEAPAEGPLFEMIRSLGLPDANIAETHRRFLTALEPLIAAVDGATLYRLENLDPIGRPLAQSTIRVLRKTGSAAAIPSRSEQAKPLSGTKWGVVKSGSVYLGLGKNDGRKILIVPVVGESETGHLLLYHLQLSPKGRREERLAALRAHADLLDRIQIAVTERNVPWTDDLIEGVDNDALFFETPDAVAERLLAYREPATAEVPANSGTDAGIRGR